MKKKVICKACGGNGYIQSERSKNETVILQCDVCKSQGEITVNGKQTKKV